MTRVGACTPPTSCTRTSRPPGPAGPRAGASITITTTRPGWAKGWGLHHHHDDRYVIWQGRVELALYDARAGSRTEGLESRLFLSEADRCLVTIPAGVWHAERNIGDDEVVIVNFPTEPFHHAAPDKERLPLDNDVLPVDLGRDWRGW